MIHDVITVAASILLMAVIVYEMSENANKKRQIDLLIQQNLEVCELTSDVVRSYAMQIDQLINVVVENTLKYAERRATDSSNG